MNKIAIAHSLYSPDIVGGAEISTQMLAETLSSSFTVSVITVGGQEENMIRETINNVEVIRLFHSNLYWYGDIKRNKSSLQKIIWRLNDCFNVKQYRSVKNILSEMQPDVLHTQNLSGLSISIWWAARKLNIPIVHTLRDHTLINPVPNKFFSFIYQQLIKYFSSHVTSVIGISNSILNKHLSIRYFVNADTYTVFNAVETSPFSKELYSNKVIHNNGGLVLGYFGQLVTIKGVDLLIQAVKNLPHDIVEKLYICGEGMELESLKKLASVDDRIVFLGRLDRKETSKKMCECDITIVPSIWDEPFGRVIIESYQVGTVVLASKVGGIPEIILDKEQHLFKAGSVKAIIDAIKRYYNLTTVQKNALKNSCYIHSQNFSTEALLQHHKEIYRKVIKPEM